MIDYQKAEIEKYKGVIKILENDVANAKYEAIKEFAERLKELKIKPEYPWDDYYINENAIDNLVKQMTEVHK